MKGVVVLRILFEINEKIRSCLIYKVYIFLNLGS